MRWSLALLLSVSVTVSLARTAAGQGVEVPRFQVAEPTIEDHVGACDVAVGGDGKLLVLYTEWKSRSFNAGKAVTA
jgi:hypothetical protein